jgi:hypothetical protein
LKFPKIPLRKSKIDQKIFPHTQTACNLRENGAPLENEEQMRRSSQKFEKVAARVFSKFVSI